MASTGKCAYFSEFSVPVLELGLGNNESVISLTEIPHFDLVMPK